MKRVLSITTLLIILSAGLALSAGMSLADVEPAKGDKTVYSVFEQTTLTFENTPVNSSSRGTGTETSEVLAVSKGTGKTVFMMLTTRAVKTTQSQSNKEEETVSHSLETCRATPGGIWVDNNWTMEGGRDTSVDVGQAFLEMRVPCLPGTAWRGGRLTYKDGFSVRPKSEAVGTEDAEVPAGTFKGCLKVVTTSPDGFDGYLAQEDQRLEIVSGEMQVTSWYYPRVGIVKEVSVTTLRVRPEGADAAAVLNMQNAVTQTLTEYKLGK